MCRAIGLFASAFGDIVKMIKEARRAVAGLSCEPSGWSDKPDVSQSLTCKLRIGCRKTVNSLCFGQLITEIRGRNFRSQAHRQKDTCFIAVCPDHQRHIEFFAVCENPIRGSAQKPPIDERIN